MAIANAQPYAQTRSCRLCDTTFQPINTGQIYCETCRTKRKPSATKLMLPCVYCGIPFLQKTHNQRFCKYTCQMRHNAGRIHEKNENEARTRECLRCNQTFVILKSSAKFCSPKCRTYHHFETHPTVCPGCQKQFVRTWGAQKYCTETCRIDTKNKENLPQREYKMCIACKKMFYGLTISRTCSQLCNMNWRKYEHDKNAVQAAQAKQNGHKTIEYRPTSRRQYIGVVAIQSCPKCRSGTIANDEFGDFFCLNCGWRQPAYEVYPT